MTKQVFLTQLRKGLQGLPKADIREHLTFYEEMIQDRMEEGLSEADAIAQIGSVETIVQQILADSPVKPNRRSPGVILLLILGSPIWLSLAISALAVLFSVCVSLWAVFAGLVACTIGSVAACAGFIIGGNVATGIAVFAAGILCAGLSIFLFFACKVITKGCFALVKTAMTGKRQAPRQKEVA